MKIRSSDIEVFLREKVDSSVRVQHVIGLELGQKGVGFQYQSSTQTVWVVFEYTTIASLVLAPSYAPLSEVESVVAREKFEDSQLELLGELHRTFLEWLKTNVDKDLEPIDGRFFSSKEPIPDSVSRVLKSVEPFASMISLMGYPDGAMHLFIDLPVEESSAHGAPLTASSLAMFEPDIEEDADHQEVGGGDSILPAVVDWLIRGVVLMIVVVLCWFGWETIEMQQAVVAADPDVVQAQASPEVRTHQVRIPSGRFIMGCTQAECDADELPRRVTVLRDFFMLESEVTQEQFYALMRSNPSHNYQCGKSCPVDSVTWEQAVEYANRLSKNNGYSECYKKTTTQWEWDISCLGWRLPTEAEWERAALGVRNGKSETSDGEVKIVPLEKTAWYVDKSVLDSLPSVVVGNEKKQQEMVKLFVESHPVCSKARNGYGLCDMSGNVWEWVWDWYDPDAPTDGHDSRNPKGPQLGRSKVLKGGAFNSSSRDIYPHRRIHLAPWATMGEVRFEGEKASVDVLQGSVGFRLVRTAR